VRTQATDRANGGPQLKNEAGPRERARPGPSRNRQDGTASLEGCGYGAAARCGERHYGLECELILVCGCR
jgi:hypothetical protein